MQLVEKHIVHKRHEFYKEVDALSFKSKNLYNAALYVIRQNFIFGWGYLNYQQMDKLMQSHETYSKFQVHEVQ